MMMSPLVAQITGELVQANRWRKNFISRLYRLLYNRHTTYAPSRAPSYGRSL